MRNKTDIRGERGASEERQLRVSGRDIVANLLVLQLLRHTCHDCLGCAHHTHSHRLNLAGISMEPPCEIDKSFDSIAIVIELDLS